MQFDAIARLAGPLPTIVIAEYMGPGRFPSHRLQAMDERRC